jgi:RNA polymerase sigma-70 factor (ECF subfamily)
MEFAKKANILYFCSRFCKKYLHHHIKPSKMLPNIQQQLEDITSSLRAFAMSLTGNEVDAEDLYQDTAYRILANTDKYEQGTNFKAWAVTIMRNIFINNYRKKVRRNTILDQTPNNYYINSGDVSVENGGDTLIAYKDLLRMVSQLPEDFKRPFWMAYKGFKYDEIAEQLEAPLGTIKSRIFFARKKLMKMYEDSNMMRA